jgi:hypothetical protein
MGVSSCLWEEDGPGTYCLFLALQNVYAPEDDPEMKVERYKRTFDQNEELGLNDMKTEGYEAGLAPQR